MSRPPTQTQSPPQNCKVPLLQTFWWRFFLDDHALANRQFSFKVFFITQLGHGHCLATITIILDISLWWHTDLLWLFNHKCVEPWRFHQWPPITLPASKKTVSSSKTGICKTGIVGVQHAVTHMCQTCGPWAKYGRHVFLCRPRSLNFKPQPT